MQLHLERISKRRLDLDAIKDQLSHIIRRALSGARGRAWERVGAARVHSPKEDNGNGWKYNASVNLERTGRKAGPAIINKQWQAIRDAASVAAQVKGWLLLNEPSAPGEKPEPANKPPSSRDYSQISLSAPMAPHFANIFEREAQIAIVQSAIEAFNTSHYEDRFHCVLHGAPASGKTEILLSFAKWLGPESVLIFDATSTTKAGAERILLETAQIPPIMIVEEIEKTDEKSLRWMLSALDQRGEVRKVTHGGGLRRKDIKNLCLATVNDMGLFNKAMDGALASRFSHPIFCPRPSRDALEKILAAHIAKVGGNLAWIKPAIDWCLDVEKTTDPRRIKAVCLSGKNELLTGAYQRKLALTRLPKKEG